MSVLWVTRIFAFAFAAFTYLITNYDMTWKTLDKIWKWSRRFIAAAIVGYVSHYLMMKLWYARPDAYLVAEATLDHLLGWLWRLCTTIFAFIAELVSNKALNALLYGFNITTPTPID